MTCLLVLISVLYVLVTPSPTYGLKEHFWNLDMPFWKTSRASSYCQDLSKTDLRQYLSIFALYLWPCKEFADQGPVFSHLAGGLLYDSPTSRWITGWSSAQIFTNVDKYSLKYWRIILSIDKNWPFSNNMSKTTKNACGKPETL